MQSVFVTGASGFIGSAVVDELRRRGYPVVAVARSAPRRRGGGEWTQVGSYGELDPPAGARCVHLAGARDTGTSEVDIVAAAGDLEALARAFERLVYVSSASVYGDAGQAPRNEDDPEQADTPYRELKLALEAVALEASHVVARPANVYGLGMAPNSVVMEVAAQIGKAGALTVRDDKAVRDFVHVRDVAAGLVDAVLVGERDVVAGAVLNIGTGAGTSVGALAQLMLSLAGERHREVVSTSPAPRRSHLVVDPGRMRRLLGWVAATDLGEGLLEVLEGRP